MPTTSRTRRSVAISTTADATLRRYTAAHGVAVSSLIRRAIEHYVAILDETAARLARAEAALPRHRRGR